MLDWVVRVKTLTEVRLSKLSSEGKLKQRKCKVGSFTTKYCFN